MFGIKKKNFIILYNINFIISIKIKKTKLLSISDNMYYAFKNNCTSYVIFSNIWSKVKNKI